MSSVNSRAIRSGIQRRIQQTRSGTTDSIQHSIAPICQVQESHLNLTLIVFLKVIKLLQYNN